MADPITDRFPPVKRAFYKMSVSPLWSNASAASSSSGSSLTIPDPVIFKFTTVEHLFRQLETMSEGTVTVEDVSIDDFEKWDAEREFQYCPYRLFLYTADRNELIITIPSAGHEGLLDDITQAVVMHSKQNGLKLRLFFSQTYQQRDGSSRRIRAAEGDQGFGPKLERASEHCFPTVIIEVGYSQSWAALRMKMAFWFDISGGDVKIVLVIKPNAAAKQITIEQWKLGNRTSRLGATTTRLSSFQLHQPVCVQLITITQNPTIGDTDPDRFNPACYDVTRGDLVLDFIDVYLRQPISPETDIIMDERFLQSTAAEYWKYLAV